jgi:hypothetical protein
MLSHVQGAIGRSKRHFSLVVKNEGQFMIVDYLARAILNIFGNQIEIERVFSSVGILTSLC